MAPKTQDMFLLDDDFKLVNLVKKYPFLFDAQHEHAKNQGVRDNVWKEISDEMQRSGEECKKRWKNIKDTYNKNKRNKKLRSGQLVNGKPSKWALAEVLTFLDDSSNLNVNDIIQNDSFEVRLSDLKSESVDNDYNNGQEDGGNDYTIVAEDQSPKLLENSFVPSTFNDQAGPLKSRDTVKRQSIPADRHTTKKAKPNDEDPNLSINKYHVSPVTRAVTPAQIIDDDNDTIDIFFKCMAMTVKKFPTHLKIVAKKEIFKLVTNLEMECNRLASM